ncbi:hypothetical protein JCM8208_005280 [Rhodotorula glutinis]
MTVNEDSAAFAPSSSSSDSSPPRSPRARSTSTSTSTSRTTPGSTTTHTSTPSLAGAAPSPTTATRHPPSPAVRKGRWTASEHAEVLRTGDTAASSASWDVLRRGMTGDARLRSAPALRARYLQLSTSGDMSPPSRLVHKEHPAVAALPKSTLFLPPSSPHPSSVSPSALTFPPAPAPPPLAPHDPHAPPPWSIDEDTALLTAMATPQLGAQTWAGMHALAARIYRLGPGEGREWTRSEREVQRRWDGVLRDGQFAPTRWPDALVPALVAIHTLLTEKLQAQLDSSNPGLAAASLPRPTPQPAQAHSTAAAVTATAPKSKPLGSPMIVKPATAAPVHHSPTAPSSSPSTSTATRPTAPHLASTSSHRAPLPLAQGRAAPPFPARNSPLPGPSTLPRPPATPHTSSLARPHAPEQQQRPPPPPQQPATQYQARPLPLSVPLGPAYHLPSPLSSSTSLPSSLPTTTPMATSTSSARAHVHLPPMRLAPGPAPARLPPPPDGAYGVLDLERALGLAHGRGFGHGLAQAGGPASAGARARMSFDVGASWSALVGAGAGEGGVQGRKRALSVSAGAGREGWRVGEEDGRGEGSAAKKARRESA